MDIVQSQFTPGADSGALSRSLLSGLQMGSSLAERGQIMRQREQQMKDQADDSHRRDALDAILTPVRQAKAQADIAEAKANVDGLQQTEQMRQHAMEILPQARSDFNDMMKIQDPDAREQAGFDWVGKYGQLANVTTFSKEFGGYKDIIAKNHQDASTLRLLDAKTQAESDLLEQRGAQTLDILEGRKNTALAVEGMKSDTAKSVAATRAGTSENNAQTRASALVTAARGRTVLGLIDQLSAMDEDPAANPEVKQALIADIKKHGQFAPQKMAEFEKNWQNRQAALAAGDQEAADAYDARNRALASKSDIPDTYPSKPKPPEPPGFLSRVGTAIESKLGIGGSTTESKPVPAPEPPKIPSNTKTVTIDGKDYPILKDAKGNRAYYKDGHYVPIP